MRSKDLFNRVPWPIYTYIITRSSRASNSLNMTSKIAAGFLFLLLLCSQRLAAQVCKVSDHHDHASHSSLFGNIPLVAGRFVPAHIGVVFHLLHNGGEANLDTSALREQIDVLNRAYNGTGFSFYLALVTRTQNPSWFMLPEVGLPPIEVREALAFAPTRMINVFVGDMRNEAMGWSVFADTNNPESHAIVIDYLSLPGGPFDPDFDTGITLVHEVGHYMGLRHPFERGCLSDPTKGDFVEDTPAASEVWFRQCPAVADSCPNIPGNDPVTNYMHVTTDACRVRWTRGQIERMETLALRFRADIGGQVIDLPSTLTIDPLSEWAFYEGTFRFPQGAQLTLKGRFEANNVTFTTSGTDWRGLSFARNSEGVLKNVHIYEVNGEDGHGGLIVSEAKVQLDEVAIAVSPGSSAYGLLVQGPGSEVRMTNSNVRSASNEAIRVSGPDSRLFLHNTHVIQQSDHAAIHATNEASVLFGQGGDMGDMANIGLNRIEGGRLLATENGLIDAGQGVEDRSQNHFCDTQSAVLETLSGGTIYATHNFWPDGRAPVLRGENIRYGFNQGMAVCEGITVSVSDDASLTPSESSVPYNLQNYPNPFSSRTTFSFVLPQPGHMAFTIYDILGRPVETLLDAFTEAGPHELVFDASHLPSGTYLYRLKTTGEIRTRTMNVVR